MRHPHEIERLYLDFDGFFASVEQQVHPHLRGKPVGVVPFTTAAIDRLNRKHGRTLVSIGPWTPPPGGYAGGKISYTRIPRAEDFW